MGMSKYGLYETERESTLKRFRKDFKEHGLTVLAETDKILCVRIGKPNTRINSTQITFTPEGITIQGDWCPCGNGVCSTFGYDQDWFAKGLSWSYLAEKFLAREFVDEAAIDDLQQRMDDGGMEPNRLFEAKELMERLVEGCSEYRDTYAEFCYAHSGDPGGYDYNITAVCQLQVIQETFARLWSARSESCQ